MLGWAMPGVYCEGTAFLTPLTMGRTERLPKGSGSYPTPLHPQPECHPPTADTADPEATFTAMWARVDP